MKLEQLFQKFPEVLGKQQNVSLVDSAAHRGRGCKSCREKCPTLKYTDLI